MSRASEELFISPSSISQTIAEIEAEYGVKLFDRLSKKIYITNAGKLLLDHAQQVIYSYDRLDKSMRNSSEKALLRIGATMTVGTCLINPLLNKYYEIYSNVDVHVDISNSISSENKILNSKLDVAIIQEIVKSKDILYQKLWTDDLVLVCCPQHKLAGKEIDIRLLSGEAFILREQGSGTRRILEDALKETDIDIVCSWTCSNTEAIKNAIRYCRGITLISKLLVEKELKCGKFSQIFIKDKKFSRNIYLIHHKNKYINQALDEFIHICKSTTIGQLTNINEATTSDPLIS